MKKESKKIFISLITIMFITTVSAEGSLNQKNFIKGNIIDKTNCNNIFCML